VILAQADSGSMVFSGTRCRQVTAGAPFTYKALPAHCAQEDPSQDSEEDVLREADELLAVTRRPRLLWCGASAAGACALLAAAAAFRWRAADPAQLRRVPGAVLAAPGELVLELQANASPAEAGSAVRPRALDEGSCRARLRRLQEVAAQRLESPPDPLFPAEASSVSGSGGSCGDSASKASTHCSHFNHWGTLRSIADQQGLPDVVVFGSSVRPDDVDQGRLGDCYFLSALASVAHACPTCIMGMFVQRHNEKNGVYTTRWLLDGVEMEVSVDHLVPAKYATPYFAQVSNGVFWPVILEKAWAKILGSYHAAEAGNWLSAVGAITRSPVKSVWHPDLTQDDLWNELERASSMHFPVGASTGDGASSYNLPVSHAYAVILAHVDPKYGRVVRCFNPWNSDRYRGAVPNENKGDGIFDMKLDEYYHAFRTTQIGLVTPNYISSFHALQVSKQMSALTFSIASEDTFHVSLVWPMRKLVEPCQLRPSVTLAIARQAKSGTFGEIFHGEESNDAAVNMVTAKAAGGIGTYDVFVSADFPSEVADRVVVVVYASEEVSITSSPKSASEVALAMFGPECNESHVSFVEHGVFTPSPDKLVRGIPTYWSIDDAEFAYYTSRLWFVTSAAHWQAVSQGKLYYSARVAAREAGCGCLDAPTGVRGFDAPCARVSPPHLKYSNVACEGAQYSALVRRCCPVTCGACPTAAGPAPASPRTLPPTLTSTLAIDDDDAHDAAADADADGAERRAAPSASSGARSPGADAADADGADFDASLEDGAHDTAADADGADFDAGVDDDGAHDAAADADADDCAECCAAPGASGGVCSPGAAAADADGADFDAGLDGGAHDFGADASGASGRGGRRRAAPSHASRERGRARWFRKVFLRRAASPVVLGQLAQLGQVELQQPLPGPSRVAEGSLPKACHSQLQHRFSGTNTTVKPCSQPPLRTVWWTRFRVD
ncbi:unnamed protein product, partial [Prorocentrum cordatum]